MNNGLGGEAAGRDGGPTRGTNAEPTYCGGQDWGDKCGFSIDRAGLEHPTLTWDRTSETSLLIVGSGPPVSPLATSCSKVVTL